MAAVAEMHLKKENFMIKFNFAKEAETILDLDASLKVNELGGYGPNGEVVYYAFPPGCPSTLADKQGPAKAVFMSNGSLEFTVKIPEGMEIRVLGGSFDPVQKREIGPLSANVWLGFMDDGIRKVCSLVNPKINMGCSVTKMKYVKSGRKGKNSAGLAKLLIINK